MARYWLFVTVCTLMFSHSTSARVFQRWSGKEQWQHGLEASGAHRAYDAPVTVNGRNARIAAFRFNRPIEDVLPRLREVFPSARIAWRGGRMALFLLHFSEHRLHMLVLELSGGNAMALALLEDVTATAEARVRTYPPPYPGSLTGFSFENHERAFQMTVSQTASSPVDVLSYYDTLLTNDGWQRPFPANMPSAVARAHALYFRGNRLCFVHASGDGSGTTSITLLHKKERFQ